jgi:hypothetical protein
MRTEPRYAARTLCHIEASANEGPTDQRGDGMGEDTHRQGTPPLDGVRQGYALEAMHVVEMWR